jgi:hypothetical protein
MTNSSFRPGDAIRFRANGVEGTVTRVSGPAVNSGSRAAVIEWTDDEGHGCIHDASKLEKI